VVVDFEKLDESRFLITTLKGLDILDSDESTVYPLPKSDQDASMLPEGEYAFVLVDEWDNVWVGHDAGLSVTSKASLSSSYWSAVSLNSVGPIGEIRSNPIDGRLWIGSNGDVMSMAPNNGIPKKEVDIAETTGFAANITVTDIEFLDSKIVIGTGSHGLVATSKNNRSWHHVSLTDHVDLDIADNGKNAVRSLTVRAGKLMVATSGAGVIEMSSVLPPTVNGVFNKPWSQIIAINMMTENSLLAGTISRGVFSLQEGDSTMTKENPWGGDSTVVNRGMINDVFTSEEHGNVAATMGGVISWTSADSTWLEQNESSGLPSEVITNVAGESTGTIWFTTEKALCKGRFDEMQSECVRVIGSNSADEIQPSAMEVLDESVAIGTAEGLLMVPKSVIPPRERLLLPFTLTLSSDRDEPVEFGPEGGKLEFDKLADVITIDAELSAFAEADLVRLSYHLHEVDDSPTEVSSTVFSVPYHELPHRDEPYLLDVEVRTGSGLIYQTRVEFTLPLPFWQTYWFILASTVSLGGLASWRSVSWFKTRQREARELQLALATGREQERASLSRQLHDLSLQNLYVIKQQFHLLESKLEESETGSIEQSLDQTIDELRRICGELLPPSLGPFGLESAIRSFLQTIEHAHPDVHIQMDAHVPSKPSDESSLAIIRAAQTSVANVVRHASATELKVTLASNERDVQLTVSDNGSGFDVPDSLISLARNRHYGLLGLHELSKQFGGQFHVESQPGIGTHVSFSIPLTDSNSDSADPSLVQ